MKIRVTKLHYVHAAAFALGGLGRQLILISSDRLSVSLIVALAVCTGYGARAQNTHEMCGAPPSYVPAELLNRTLPLRKDLGTLAVIGPNADQWRMLLGNYNGTPSHPVTILDESEKWGKTWDELFLRK